MATAKNSVITVDGPSGAGKGTICRLLAQKLGFHLLDSGALYRLTALAGMRAGIDLNSASHAADVAANLDVLFDVQGDGIAILLGGDDVSPLIRGEDVGMGASIVAAHPAVREALLQRQRAFAQSPGLVADGRDMGTVVFPEADLKIFLTASAAERARRRKQQLYESGVEADYTSILADIEARDQRDSNRAVAPLMPAQDAVLLDSTELSVAQVLQRIMSLLPQPILPNS